MKKTIYHWEIGFKKHMMKRFFPHVKGGKKVIYSNYIEEFVDEAIKIFRKVLREISI